MCGRLGSLQVGQIAGPIESPVAFHILKLESRVPEEVTSLEKARDGITEHIRDEKFKTKIDEYLKKLWTDNFIYIYPKFGTSDWLPTGAAENPLGGE